MHHLIFRNILSVIALCLSASAIAITIPVDVKYGLELGFGNKHLYAQAIDFHYTHLWTSKNGTTHFAECYMKGFKSQVYAKGTPPISKLLQLQPTSSARHCHWEGLMAAILQPCASGLRRRSTRHCQIDRVSCFAVVKPEILPPKNLNYMQVQPLEHSNLWSNKPCMYRSWQLQCIC